jgi:hypothetical protein
MTNRLKEAAIDGFVSPFRLVVALLSALVAVVVGFATQQGTATIDLPRQHEDTKQHG